MSFSPLMHSTWNVMSTLLIRETKYENQTSIFYQFSNSKLESIHELLIDREL